MEVGGWEGGEKRGRETVIRIYYTEKMVSIFTKKADILILHYTSPGYHQNTFELLIVFHCWVWRLRHKIYEFIVIFNYVRSLRPT